MQLTTTYIRRASSPDASVLLPRIILFHDGGGPREQTVAAVAQLILWLRAQGYSFALPG